MNKDRNPVLGFTTCWFIPNRSNKYQETRFLIKTLLLYSLSWPFK